MSSDEFMESANFRMFALNWYYDQVTDTNKEALQNVRSSIGLVLEESEVCQLVVAVNQAVNYLANQSYVR